ncbi:hypothetical protein K8I28_00595 [bacterium]|nr:hypothetical protein [bacterium]
MNNQRYTINFIRYYTSPSERRGVPRHIKFILITLLLLAVVLLGVGVWGNSLPASHKTVRIARYNTSGSTIWAMLTTPQDFPIWRSDIESVKMHSETWPMTWEEIDKKGGSIIYRIQASYPPRRLEVVIASENLPFSGGWTYELQEEKEGVLLKVTEDGTISNPFVRCIWHFFMDPAMTLERYLQDLSENLGQDYQPVSLYGNTE